MSNKQNNIALTSPTYFWVPSSQMVFLYVVFFSTTETVPGQHIQTRLTVFLNSCQLAIYPLSIQAT